MANRVSLHKGSDYVAVRAMRDKANADPEYTQRCIRGEKVFFVWNAFARMPGHIYSEEGIEEFRISRCCEYHFDRMFAPDDEEE